MTKRFFKTIIGIILFYNYAYAEESNDLENEIFKEAIQETPEKEPSSSNANNVKNENNIETTPTTIGGNVQWQSNFQKLFDQHASSALFGHSTSAELYLDSRPYEHWRAFIRGNMDTLDGKLNTSLSEIWAKWDNSEVFVTLGQQRIKWGASTFWNPTDFLVRTTRDPFSFSDKRLGTQLLKIHIPMEKYGYNFYGIINFENTVLAKDLSYALRSELMLGNSELSITAKTGYKQPVYLGVDISAAVGPLDFTAEGALQKNSSKIFYKRGDNLGTDQFVVIEEDKKNTWLPQGVFGANYQIKYSDSDNLTLGTEYFWNGIGYTDTLLESYAWISDQLPSLYLGRQYIAAFARLPSPGDWNNTTLSLTALSNISDMSEMLRFSSSFKILDKGLLQFDFTEFFGVGEFGKKPEELEKISKNFENNPILKSKIDALKKMNSQYSLGIAFSLNI